ncbi:MAG TPA: Tex-like N-terminal domain-containing protein [Lacipirellulaceae bacterium]|nr:Tex-like N-terminal domain-containing protein [Lacipirellulaceae bacterium]
MASVISIDFGRLTRELGIDQDKIARTVALLDDGNTVPFITRYRRDQTGGLDEEQIGRIRESITKLRLLDERKQTILRSIESQHALTDELREQIARADSVKRLEDLYLPYRPKKQTLATKAHEQGLAPLAKEILTQDKAAADLDKRAADFINADKGIPDAATALLGAGHILAEQFSEDPEVRQKVRKVYRKTGKLNSAKLEDNPKKNQQFHDYLDFREPLSRIPPHRVLAINRGERAKVLRVQVEADAAAIEELGIEQLVPADHAHKDFLTGCVRDALSRLILPSLEREARRELTEKAETHGVEVFARNLRNLLLQPPLPGRRVLAVDPGYKNGCKLAALDEFGKLLAHDVMYVIGSDEQKAAGRAKLVEFITNHNVSVIAIGNGTACRQMEQLIAEVLATELTDQDVHYVVVNEAGASVYSTSEVGREEFPECDAIQRSAISIGRRLQDPLSELVKIDPASIGVGLYQHDARAKHLRDSLDDVVQSCVSFVGVELNSASTPLLRYVSGMNQLTARRVYEHRQTNGPFKSRQQLLEVSGLGNATFVQSAGFLKIVGGDQPLDATWIHPENYEAAGKLLAKLGIDPTTVASGASAVQIRDAVASLDRQALPGELGVGQLALDDMIEALCRPGRDPREDLPPPIFRKDVVKFEDLLAGMELRGTVLNVVDFGAFVDVGLSDSGLIHISQLSAGYVRDPHEVVAVGDQVRVWVSAIDQQRRRVALTMIAPGTERPQPAKSRRGGRRRPEGAPSQRPQQPAAEGNQPPPEKAERPRRPAPKQRRDRRGPPQRQPRTGAYEKRAPKKLVPITKEMEEGKAYLRSFGDLLQFQKKKQEHESDESKPSDHEPPANANGATS